RTAVRGLDERAGPDQRSGSASPGVALQVLGGVEADPENPGAQVTYLADSFAGTPTLQKGLLSCVLVILIIAEHIKQGAHQLDADLVEGANQLFSRRAHVLRDLRPHGAGCWRFAHAICQIDE